MVDHTHRPLVVEIRLERQRRFCGRRVTPFLAHRFQPLGCICFAESANRSSYAGRYRCQSQPMITSATRTPQSHLAGDGRNCPPYLTIILPGAIVATPSAAAELRHVEAIDTKASGIRIPAHLVLHLIQIVLWAAQVYGRSFLDFGGAMAGHGKEGLLKALFKQISPNQNALIRMERRRTRFLPIVLSRAYHDNREGFWSKGR